MSHRLDHLLLGHLARNEWVATRSDLVQLGIGTSAIDHRLRIGMLTSFGNGVIGLTAVPDPARRLAAAALLAHPLGALSHVTAAALHRLPAGERGDVHLTVPHGTIRATTPVTIHQSRWLPDADLTVVDGLRSTTVARTVCDLAPLLGSGRFLWLVQWVVKEQRCSAGELRACARSLDRKGRPGSTKRRLAIAQLDDDAPVDLSVLEYEFLRLTIEFEIPGLVPQYAPPWYDGLRGIVDFACPARRRIVEVDGRRWHSLVQDQRRDRERDRLARSHGWLVARYGHDEVTTRPAEVAADLRLFLGLDQAAA